MSYDGNIIDEVIKDRLSDSDNLVVMYVGNLEAYQGIDLLLQGFSLSVKADIKAELFVIGGEQSDIEAYTKLSQDLGIANHVHFLGPRPVKSLSYYLEQADILASPRIKGKNTPMKIYSYLGSGKAVIATNLETHTQVLTNDLAMLVEPNPSAFAQGLFELSQSDSLRQALGEAGQSMIRENFSLEAFTERANRLLDWVQGTLSKDITSTVKP
ncbi:glycosyltransferase family 4 protein [Oscillatoria sp. CS-180]|uniref:glycosyltransferase family 4 protein n=1 Tax=Oscillatoria sp. CS-180 TaxID=3021720 RepID=UPI00232D7E6C|nr:glycosyltransferase family 4 protein [Oscillatoria sp. CS-180]MDB9526585.1 glycosyltransferase family 4 protein [Oscillatoria sp. CS-180]